MKKVSFIICAMLLLIFASSCNIEKNKQENDYNISFKTENSTYYSDTNFVRCMLKNNTSDKVLVTGEDYKIERYIDSNWEEIPNKFFVHSIGLIIIPDKSNEISCQITDIGKTLDKGKYRIKKVVEVYNLIEIVTIPNSNGTVDEIPRYDMKNETPDKVNVYAEFTVE